MDKPIGPNKWCVISGSTHEKDGDPCIHHDHKKWYDIFYGTDGELWMLLIGIVVGLFFGNI